MTAANSIDPGRASMGESRRTTVVSNPFVAAASIAAAVPVAAKPQLDISAGGATASSHEFDDEQRGHQHAGKHLPGLAADEAEKLHAQASQQQLLHGSPSLRALFQRRIDRSEVGVERGADAVDGGEDHDADADRDQAIFDGGSARFIMQESRNQFPHY